MQLTRQVKREITEAIELSDMQTQIHLDGDRISVVPQGQTLDSKQGPKLKIGVLVHKGHEFLIYIR